MFFTVGLQLSSFQRSENVFNRPVHISPNNGYCENIVLPLYLPNINLEVLASFSTYCIVILLSSDKSAELHY